MNISGLHEVKVCGQPFYSVSHKELNFSFFRFSMLQSYRYVDSGYMDIFMSRSAKLAELDTVAAREREEPMEPV